MTLPKKCLVDTNVPKTANLAISPSEIPHESTDCVAACVDAIAHVIKNGGLVIDDGDEIFDEYRKNLCLSGHKGIGNTFMKWVFDNRWNLPDSDRVTITRNNGSYNQFPTHPDLCNFDGSDRKFIAVANAHPEKPPILQATDSKWWGWKDALANAEVTVLFLCPPYIKTKYEKKMGKREAHER